MKFIEPIQVNYERPEFVKITDEVSLKKVTPDCTIKNSNAHQRIVSSSAPAVAVPERFSGILVSKPASLLLCQRSVN
jgi:hypothetical protein